MATPKKYKVNQKVNVNGQIKTCSFQVYMDEADLIALLALLEGGYEVSEVNATLSDMSGANTLQTQTNPVSSITVSGSMTDATGNPKSIFETIKPFTGSIHFKQTASVDDIADVLKVSTPFSLAPAEKPTRISVKRNESRV